MSSPVLEAMLYGPMSQAKEGRPHHLTLLEDLPATFEWLLRYLYRDETRFQGTVQALSVYEAAHKYQMDSLARLCSQVSVGCIGWCGWNVEVGVVCVEVC